MRYGPAARLTTHWFVIETQPTVGTQLRGCPINQAASPARVPAQLARPAPPCLAFGHVIKFILIHINFNNSATPPTLSTPSNPAPPRPPLPPARPTPPRTTPRPAWVRSTGGCAAGVAVGRPAHSQFVLTSCSDVILIVARSSK